MGDDATEALRLDPFSRIFPLPYRVATTIVLGIWLWGINLHLLALLRIDVALLIKVYRLAALLSAPLMISLFLFWSVTQGDAASVIAWEILPQSYLLCLGVFFALPLRFGSKTGRYRFLTILRRISVGGIADSPDEKFGDILAADTLTSYARILGDLFVSGCMFISGGRSSTALPDRSCGSTFIVPLLISFPYLIRLRQCLTEHMRARKNSQLASDSKSFIWGSSHLANALKYASSFPVIILSAMQREYDPQRFSLSEISLYRLWLFFVFLNSFYSFYWDVVMDWDLTMFSKQRDSPYQEWGLRRHTYFKPKEVYYFAIVLDVLLRWTLFTLVLLEVIRRWIWIFFRVEAEWIRVTRGSSAEILLTDYHGRDGYSDYE